jgi:ABC-type transport system substrate-binding protein
MERERRRRASLAQFAAQSLALAGLMGALALAGCRARPQASYPPGAGALGDAAPRSGGHAVFCREEDPDYLDPALSYGTYSAALVEGIFRGLLEYADAPGAAGTRLVPELADALPDVREGGTLYAFRVRPDARFGAPLHRHITAADFKYGFERQFRLGGPGVGFYSNVVGAQEMLAQKDTAIAGVVARGDSLYFRLVHPDPIFTTLLALTFTAPVPREIDVRWPNAFSQHAVSSGPFQVAEFTPRRRVVLVRNPDYCGPPALLDTFELKLGVTPANAVALVRKGEVDGGMFEVPAADYARLRLDPAWRQQLDVADGINTEYLFLNVREKPFDDLRVRQAVAWAIDRRAVLKVHVGLGVVAGEFLPPAMPGAVKLGRYLGPDVAKAKALLAAAGYPRGLHVKLYSYSTEPLPRELALIQQQLGDAGIDATLDLGEAVGYTSMAEDTSNHIAFGRFAWTADYIDPSNFFDTLFNGKRITATNNLNLSLLDDPTVNRWIVVAMAEADSARRAALWQRVDARVMDLAPVVPLIHVFESRLYAPRLGGWYRHETRLLKIDRLYLKRPAGQAGPTVAQASPTGARR